MLGAVRQSHYFFASPFFENAVIVDKTVVDRAVTAESAVNAAAFVAPCRVFSVAACFSNTRFAVFSVIGLVIRLVACCVTVTEIALFKFAGVNLVDCRVFTAALRNIQTAVAVAVCSVIVFTFVAFFPTACDIKNSSFGILVSDARTETFNGQSGAGFLAFFNETVVALISAFAVETAAAVRLTVVVCGSCSNRILAGTCIIRNFRKSVVAVFFIGEIARVALAYRNIAAVWSDFRFAVGRASRVVVNELFVFVDAFRKISVNCVDRNFLSFNFLIAACSLGSLKESFECYRRSVKRLAVCIGTEVADFGSTVKFKLTVSLILETVLREEIGLT